MPKTVDEYIAQVQPMLGGATNFEPTAAILHYTASSSMVGSGFTWMPDFGFLIAWLRYGLTADEFHPSSLPLWKYSEEELRERRAAAEAGYDQLLNDFVQRGHTPELEERLLEIGNDNVHKYMLNTVLVLPDDLDEVLNRTGNPLVDWAADEDDGEQPITAASIGFDLDNPERRARLAERLDEVG